MRDLTAAELLLLARVLSRAESHERMDLAQRIVAETKAAALYLQMSGRCHPHFGDGSLQARCLRLDPPAEPLVSDADFRDAIIVACTVIGMAGLTDPALATLAVAPAF